MHDLDVADGYAALTYYHERPDEMAAVRERRDDLEYETGKAVFQVEETDVPRHLRQAAVTESGSLVAAMEQYFGLIWEHESESAG